MPALNTRPIGLQTHFSRHPLAPMEIVYEVEKPPGFWARLWRLSLVKKYALFSVIFSIGYGIWAAIEIAQIIQPETLGLIGLLASLFFGAVALRRFFNPY